MSPVEEERIVSLIDRLLEKKPIAGFCVVGELESEPLSDRDRNRLA